VREGALSLTSTRERDLRVRASERASEQDSEIESERNREERQRDKESIGQQHGHVSTRHFSFRGFVGMMKAQNPMARKTMC